MGVLRLFLLSRQPATGFMAMGLMWGGFAAMVPVFRQRIEVSDGAFGSMLAASAGGLLVAMLLAPRFDASSRGRSMQIAAAGLVGAFLLIGWAATPLAFVLALVAAAFAAGTFDVVMNARVSELESRHRRSLMNFAHAMFSAAYAVGAFSTGLAREAGWGPLAVFAALGAVVLLMALSLRMTPEAPLDGAPAKVALPWAVIVPGGVLTLIAFQAEASVEAWSALHIERSLGGRAVEGAFGPTMLGLTMAAGRFAGQALTERIGERRLLSWAILVSAAGTLVAAVAPSEPVAYLGFGIVGLGISVLAPTALAMVGTRVGPGPRAFAISRVAAIGFSAFFIGPAVMGGVSEMFGLRVAFGFVGVLLLMAFVPLALLIRQPKRVAPA